MSDEIFDFNCFNLNENLVLELINRVASLCVVMSSGSCSSGHQPVTPLPQFLVSGPSLEVGFLRHNFYRTSLE